MLADIPEFEIWNDLSRMAGKYSAAGRHVERAATPAANARLWKPRIVIGDNSVDDDAALVLGPQQFDLPHGFIDLLACGHKRGAVLQRPAVILHMKDARVTALRKRLDIAGDKENQVYDDAVRDAVKAFQTENDINVDGNLGPNTVRTLNGERREVRQSSADPTDIIVVNMERLRWIPRDLGNPHAKSPAFEALQQGILEVLDSEERIPMVHKIGPRFYNFWRDKAHPKGLWRRTTLTEYRKPQPA